MYITIVVATQTCSMTWIMVITLKLVIVGATQLESSFLNQLKPTLHAKTLEVCGFELVLDKERNRC